MFMFTANEWFEDKSLTPKQEAELNFSIQVQPGDMSAYGELLLWDDNQSRGWLLAGGQLQVHRVVQTIGKIRIFCCTQ
jgi:hypothetical protein